MTIISQNYKFIFIHVPKCGGSSIEIEFERFVKWGDFVIGSTPQGYQFEKIANSLYKFGKHTTASNLRKIIGEKRWAKYRIIAIIRHPISVIESYYKFGQRRLTEICNNKKVSREQVQNAARNKGTLIPNWFYHQNNGIMIDSILSCDFQDYLSRVADNRWVGFFDNYLTEEGEIIVDDILKLEDQSSISQYFQSTVDKNFSLRHENKSPASNEMFWSDEMLAIFKPILSPICDKFGYKYMEL